MYDERSNSFRKRMLHEVGDQNHTEVIDLHDKLEPKYVKELMN